MTEELTAQDFFEEQRFPCTINGKEFHLREAGAADTAWINSQAVDGQIAINPNDPKQVEGFCKIIFMLLCDEYKPIFKPRGMDVYDEKKFVTKKCLLKSHELMAKAIKATDLESLSTALMSAMGMGQMTESEMDEMISNAEKKKKKVKRKTGRKSSTSSPANMG